MLPVRTGSDCCAQLCRFITALECTCVLFVKILTDDKASYSTYHVNHTLEDIGKEVDDAAKEVEDSAEYCLDCVGESANDGGEELVDGLEEVLECGKELSHGEGVSGMRRG